MENIDENEKQDIDENEKQDIDEIEKEYLESLIHDLESETVLEPRKPDSVIRECLVEEHNIDREKDDYEKTLELSLNMYNDSIDKVLDDSFEESLNKILKDSEQQYEIEQKKIERKIKLTNIINTINKIQKYDNQNKILEIILNIINDYINCNCELYNIQPEDYNNILKEINKYRINTDDLLYFKKIFDIIL
jgi:hypothetical protein